MKYYYEINGIKKSLKEICSENNREYSSACKMAKKGYSIEKILFSHHKATSNKKREKIYSVWVSMKTRCYTKSNPSYKWYGAKGILVCDRWKNSFVNFRNDMGEMPNEKYTIDRIDSSKNYDPSNCRWSTQKENSNNKSNNRIIEFEGNKKTLTQWSEIKGLNVRTLKARIDYLKWPLEKAMKGNLE